MTKDISVVFLDDEQNILNSLKRVFVNEPFGIATTTDPDKAIDIISKENIKVAVSDQRMPEITGIEFLRNIKEKYPDVVRILFTGYANFSTVEEAINLGEAYRFIVKPWHTQDLRVTIRQAVQHYDLVAENRNLFECARAKNEELEALNRKLKALYEVQKEFSSTVSHELRTPLASIKVGIDIVMSETAGQINPDQRKILTKAQDNANRLGRLVDNVLDLSKMEFGKAGFDIKKHNLNEIIKEVTDAQEPVVQKEKIYIKTELEQDFPEVFLDRERIIQVLNNLISNAVKFTNEGGIIVSSMSRREKNYIQICVRDTGCGIKREDIFKLFNKFQQAGESMHRAAGGVGLGLSISKEIITQHGGKIWVESEYGQGSSFYFILPIEERRKIRL